MSSPPVAGDVHEVVDVDATSKSAHDGCRAQSGEERRRRRAVADVVA
jgi:hypothetical protein